MVGLGRGGWCSIEVVIIWGVRCRACGKHLRGAATANPCPNVHSTLELLNDRNIWERPSWANQITLPSFPLRRII